MNNLGVLYLNGWGVAQDYTQARMWLEKGAAGGSDEAKKSFSLTGTLPGGWVDPTRATLMFDGTVLFEGGSGELGASYETFVYYPAKGTFDTAAGSVFPLAYNNLTLQADGTLFNTGGSLGGFPPAWTESRVAADFGSFTPSSNMVVGRYLHTATLLNNGKVLVTGGVTLTKSQR